MKTPKPPDVFEDFAQQYPEVMQAYERLGLAVRGPSKLSERETALIKLGLSVGGQMEGAVRAHVRKARALGIDRATIEQAVLLAIPTIGFPSSMAALTWVRAELSARGD